MLAMFYETLQTGAVADTSLEQFAKNSANNSCSYRAWAESGAFAPVFRRPNLLPIGSNPQLNRLLFPINPVGPARSVEGPNGLIPTGHT